MAEALPENRDRPDATDAIDQPALTPADREDLATLCRLLRFSQGEFAVILAVCNATAHREALVAALLLQCPLAIAEVTLPADTTTLFTTLRQHLGETTPQALMVYGLGDLQNLEPVLTATNQIREEFRTFTFPMVLWLTDASLKHFIRNAPDFYTWANVVPFETPPQAFQAFLADLSQMVWWQVLHSRENHFLSNRELGVAPESARYQELDAALTAIASGDITLTPAEAADLAFVQGRIADNNTEAAKAHYEDSLTRWQPLLAQTQPGPDPAWREKSGHVLFYLGLWWRNHAERYRQVSNAACQQACEYFDQAVATFEQAQRPDLAAKYINYWAETLHRLQAWDTLASVATRALALHQQHSPPFRTARAEGFLAEVALAKGEAVLASDSADLVQNLDEGTPAPAHRPNRQANRFWPWAHLGQSRAGHPQNNAGGAPNPPADIYWQAAERHAKAALDLIQPMAMAGVLAERNMEGGEPPQTPESLNAGEHLAAGNEEAGSTEFQSLSEEEVAFYQWVNRFHRSWYLFSLGRAQFKQGRVDKAVEVLEQARRITKPTYDPGLYSRLLEQLRRGYFQQGKYLQAFETRRQRDKIESQFNYRAFIGAGRLQPKQNIANPALPVEAGAATTAKDAIITSGRKHDVQRLLQRLAQDEHVLTIIHGPSGVGKSSLIEAGLLPALAQTRLETRRVMPVYLRRYRDWAGELAAALGEETQGGAGDASEALGEVGEQGSGGAREWGSDDLLNLLQREVRRNRVIVLLLDQFEEFFFEFEQAADRRDFYAFLRDCLQMPYVKVVLSLREDYIHYLLEWDRLTRLDIINRNILDKKWLYYLGNFTPDDTKAVITNLTGPTPYSPEPALVEKVVADLAAGAGEVRPIELQIVGAQLQAENITVPKDYQDWGDPELSTKELLVQKYLKDIVQECGPKANQQIADVVLYLLTDEKGTRPLKTESDLADDLCSYTNRTDLDCDALSLVLRILVRSGLVMEVPEAPEDRYQLVHDYLAAFLRATQQPLIVQLEEERRLRQAAEREQLRQARRAAVALGTVAVVAIGAGGVAWFQRQRALAGEVNAQFLADSLAMEAYLEAGLEKAAVSQAVRTAQTLQTTPARYLQGDTRLRTLSSIREVIYEAKERERLIGHDDWVNSVAFSPDGETIATASDDRTVKLWSTAGEELNTLQGHDDWVSSVAFSPDGQTIATVSGDGTVKLWSKAGEELNTLQGHDGAVYGVAFSPDGETIATASEDRTVKLWSKAGEELNTLQGHDDEVNSVAFSPDGETIATASDDRTVKLWSTAGEELNTLQGHDASVRSVAFSPDGETIATASDDGTVKLWSTAGEELTTLQGHGDWVNSVAFSPDGETIATASDDRTVKLWSPAGEELTTLQGHDDWVNSVAFSTDGETIATASFDGTVKLWSTAGEELNTLQGHDASVRSVAFSPDGETIATASGDGTVKLWSTAGEELNTLQGHDSWVSSVAFSPDGETIATASFDGTVKLWSTAGEELNTLQGHGLGVNSVAFSPDGETITTASHDRTVKLWSRAGEELTTLQGHDSWVSSVAFSPDGETIATASDDQTVKLWSRGGEELTTLQGHDDEVNSVAFSPDGETIATASDDQTVKLWSRGGEELTTLQGHGSSVNSVAFSPDGETIATASDDRTVKLWNPQLTDLIARGCNWLGTYFVKQSPDLLADLEVCQEHNPAWRVAAAPKLVEQGEILASNGQPKKANERFETAVVWDKTLDLATLEQRGQALSLIFEGRQFLAVQIFERAIEKFQASLALSPDVDPSPDSAHGPWRALCWDGALGGRAEAVLFACEQAVALNPDHGGVIDSRGLARALTGDIEGAIEDFQAFIDWGQDPGVERRQSWIEALERGENPFTPEVLEELRGE